jgi:hypothetical protein
MPGTEDMANGNDHRQYTDAATAQLGERVTNLGRRQTDMEAEMRAGFKTMESAVTSLANETRSSIASLSTNLAERNKPQWQALGVALTFAAMLGGLAYLPIREATSDLKSGVAMLADRMVTRQEMDWRQARGQEDRQRAEAGIKEVRDAQVPRAELDRVFASFVQQFSDHQRQIDEMKQAQGSVYGTRDVVFDLKKEIERLRDRDRQRSAPGIEG